jgi:hypothetical protein
MEKEFVTYEQALALKELGFDEPCIGYYENNGKNNLLVTDSVNFTNTDLKVEGISSPLYQQAFRWFREKCSIQATIEPTKDQYRFELGFNYWIWNTKTAEEWFTEPRDRPAGDYVFDTYEEAELACLEKLIEIVKEKN